MMIENIAEEIRSIHTERERLLADTRELTPEEQSALDAALAALDERVTALEAAHAEMIDGEVAAAPVAATNKLRRLDSIGTRTNKLLSQLQATSRRSLSSPAEAPAYVRDLDDKRMHRDNQLALRGWANGSRVTDEQRGAAGRAGLDLNSPTLHIDMRTQELRAQTTTGASGGFTIPPGFLAELQRTQLYYNPLRSVARVIQTETGNSITIPTLNDTTISGALGAEAVAVTETAATFSSLTMAAYRYESLMLVSNELLQDNGIDLASEIGSILGERIGRSEAGAFATGTGSSQPQGIVTGASAGVTAASATAIALTDVSGLVNSLDYAYQQSAAFMMHQTVWYQIVKLLDAFGRQLVSDPITGYEKRLYGYPVIINNKMSSAITTGQKVMLFGDFSKFLIRDSSQLEVRRLDERFADQYMTGFYATGRRDSRVLISSAIKLLTMA